MNDIIKQRLVGGIVIACLAIIILPILLDGAGVTPAEMVRDIPPKPEMPTPLVIEPERPVILSDTPALDIPNTNQTQGVVAQGVVDSTDQTEQSPNESEQQSPDILPQTQEDLSNTGVEVVEVVEVVNGTKPTLTTQGLAQSWSVRLGSFGDKDNANALVERLLNNGEKAYSRPIDSAQGQLTAVYVGPVLPRNNAQQLQARLNDEYDLSGIIVEFTIEEMEQ